MSYQLEPLTAAETARWDDLIVPYESREIFHQRVWLEYLAASRGADIRLWGIRNGSRTVGYFCGGLVRKGPFKILGSPLKGWGTNSMGPLVNRDVDEVGLLAALDGLAREEHLAMTELEHTLLGDDAFLSRHYEATPGSTYLVGLGHAGSMWDALESTCRNRIRKALRMGLTVEDTADPAIADEFYDQYSDLMQRKGLVPPYPRRSPRLLVGHLKQAGVLFALRVRDRSGRVIASGLFPHDDRTVYFWGGASWHDSHDLCPNDLLHWTVMRLAAERGLRRYNMCGDGRFKRKFGGTLLRIKRWRKCYWRSARWAQRGYQIYFEKRISVRGWLQRAAEGSPPAARSGSFLSEGS